MMKPDLNILEKDILNPYSIIHNFDVSVVIPFFRKMKEFRHIFPLNVQYFQRNGVEVIIAMDDDKEEEELVTFVKQYPFVNWKIISNPIKHEWRNPVKAINVGIRHATKKYIMVCSPESEFYSDAIYIMRKMLENYDKHYAIGTVAFALENDIESNNLDFHIPFGSIMAKKSDFENIKCYDESLNNWGGDDDNIRARLRISGIKQLFLPDVRLIHREPNQESKNKRYNTYVKSPTDMMKLLYPSTSVVNDDFWGTDFNRVIYNWKQNQYARELLMEYLSCFELYEIPDNRIFKKTYSRIILAQSYNESEHIISFLENMSIYFDGVILLDDGSSDNTYEIAKHPKLFLKVKKKRVAFIDIENRNILLALSSFFSAEWFCFMDIDERFDKRFADFEKATSNPNADILSFNFVHLWNSDSTYNAEYPYSRKGIVERMKMFRNIGYEQIFTHKKRVHFATVPHQKNVYKSEILYMHYGNISKEQREKKFKFYQKEDIFHDQKNYDHIIVDKPKLLNINDIHLSNGCFCNYFENSIDVK